MLLLTMSEWLGPGRRMTPEEIDRAEARKTQIAFATRMKLGEAIKKLYNYQTAYNAYYLLAVEYSLLQVAEIDDLSMDQLEMVNVELIENLKQSKDEFE